MPNDKWGHPFWYPTKRTAGQTGSGSGFFWQQANDFRDDEDDGMLRLGKETDDCKLINESTGEWEFPYLSEGDGLSISGGTGHHSGGENHGCQGFAYMCDSNLDANPPKFRFRKEMYHVNYDTHSTGKWTNPAATGPCEGNWKGYGWVRYNKKDGRSAGKDSVVLEVYWNDDPTGDNKWVMLKRIEDKGGWGDGGESCGGDEDQVGTWSAIQWRFKSAASDFSLHPRYPEFNEGDNIHCIDDEDMDFNEAEERGYCYKPDVPRDTEMKCLFKWDAGGDGKCRFKNISLREIDPTASFDDDPIDPTDPGGNPEPTELQGLFSIKYDINVYRESPCAAAGLKDIYSLEPDLNVWSFKAQTSPGITRERIGILAKTSSSTLVNQDPLEEVHFWFDKVGTPTGTLTVRIRSAGGTTRATMGTLDVSTLTGAGLEEKAFINGSNTYRMVTGDYLLAEYSGGDASNYVYMGKNNSISGSITGSGTNTKAVYYNTFPATDVYVESSVNEIPGSLFN